MTHPDQRQLIQQTLSRIDETICVAGWVRRVRDHGQLLFIDLWDHSGTLQCVFRRDENAELHQQGKSLGKEDVVQLTGKLVRRSEQTVNAESASGEVELMVETVDLLNAAETLPFELDENDYRVGEETRLKYRYLDLRRPEMQRTFRLRSQLIQSLRQSLFDKDFTEIETPMLTQSTKEGARDFVVPSRFNPGKFYALPQSPQQYKQLLMTAGFERYFQVARCIRDEDLRADRGFEFTQLDLEMSFVTQEQVMQTVEQAVTSACHQLGAKLKTEPFPIVTYQEAMQKYGADRFDLRTEEEKAAGVLAFAWVVDFPFFKQVDKADAAETADGKSGYTFTHNPFSAPKPEHLDWHHEHTNTLEILTSQYDLVCSGYEVGGGSIRAHRPETLRATFETMGYSEQEIEASVGHMLEAFRLGTPPHGGIALGLDRLVMILAQAQSLKDVIAFPMSSTGRTSVMDAPSEISDAQLLELGLALRGQTKRSVFDEIETLLKSRQISYQVMEHEAVRTSEEAAEVRGSALASGAKALLIKAGEEFHMVVLSAAAKLDSGKLRKALGASKTRFASPEEVEQITHCLPGAVPPFGDLFGVKLWVDESLAAQTEIDFNAGLRTKSIQMSAQDYLNLVDAERVLVTK